MAALHINRLTYQWPGTGTRTLAIDTLELMAGESLFLHGPSGCGKSTLISAIAGAVDVAQGAVQVGGQDIGALRGGARDRFRADHIGLIHQVFNLIPWLSALDNVLLPCRFSRRRHRQAGVDPARTAMRLLEELGLGSEDLMARQAIELSVGQQQRVAAARALIGRPRLVLADEPTSALDDATRAAFVDLLTRECAAAKAALLFVSHDRRLESRFDRSVGFHTLNSEAA